MAQNGRGQLQFYVVYTRPLLSSHKLQSKLQSTPVVSSDL
jgi:hypothetical protein